MCASMHAGSVFFEVNVRTTTTVVVRTLCGIGYSLLFLGRCFFHDESWNLLLIESIVIALLAIAILSFKYLQNNYCTYKDIVGIICHFIPAWICNASQISIMTGLGWSILKYGISIFVKKHIGSKKIPETDTVLASFVTINIINVSKYYIPYF